LHPFFKFRSNSSKDSSTHDYDYGTAAQKSAKPCQWCLAGYKLVLHKWLKPERDLLLHLFFADKSVWDYQLVETETGSEAGYYPVDIICRSIFVFVW
jgi:hypothetical protein